MSMCSLNTYYYPHAYEKASLCKTISGKILFILQKRKQLFQKAGTDEKHPLHNLL